MEDAVPLAPGPAHSPCSTQVAPARRCQQHKLAFPWQGCSFGGPGNGWRGNSLLWPELSWKVSFPHHGSSLQGDWADGYTVGAGLHCTEGLRAVEVM